MVFGELDEGQFDGMSAEEIRTHKMECRLREFDIEGKTAGEARSPLLVLFFSGGKLKQQTKRGIWSCGCVRTWAITRGSRPSCAYSH